VESRLSSTRLLESRLPCRLTTRHSLPRRTPYRNRRRHFSLQKSYNLGVAQGESRKRTWTAVGVGVLVLMLLVGLLSVAGHRTSTKPRISSAKSTTSTASSTLPPTTSIEVPTTMPTTTVPPVTGTVPSVESSGTPILLPPIGQTNNQEGSNGNPQNAPSLNGAPAAGTVLSDGQIQGLLSSASAQPGTNSNNVYVVYVPSGITVEADGEFSGVNFCGYHNWFRPTYTNQLISYIVLPYVSNINECNYASMSTASAVSAFDNMTPILAHEIGETVTDPQGYGWLCSGSCVNGGAAENGDLCAPHSQLFTSPATTSAYWLQYLYNNAGTCSPGGASMTASLLNYFGGVLLTNPQITTVQLSQSQPTSQSCSSTPSGYLPGTFGSGAGSVPDVIATIFSSSYDSWWTSAYFSSTTYSTFNSGTFARCMTINDASIFPQPPPSSIGAGGVLTSGQKLQSSNGQYSAVMQGDGNFVIYGPSGPVWWTGTAGTGANVFTLQRDGNIVMYSPSRAVWASMSSSSAPGSLVLQDDGNLVEYDTSGRPVWSRQTGPIAQPWFTAPVDRQWFLMPNEVLTPGQALFSQNGSYMAVMQSDGNFVLYGVHGAIWSTGTAGSGGYNFVYQADGNLVIYRQNTVNAVWNIGTDGRGAEYFVVQNDGNLVVYSASGVPIWNSGTQGH
jgi:hypothetical protein